MQQNKLPKVQRGIRKEDIEKVIGEEREELMKKICEMLEKNTELSLAQDNQQLYTTIGKQIRDHFRLCNEHGISGNVFESNLISYEGHEHYEYLENIISSSYTVVKLNSFQVTGNYYNQLVQEKLGKEAKKEYQGKSVIPQKEKISTEQAMPIAYYIGKENKGFDYTIEGFNGTENYAAITSQGFLYDKENQDNFYVNDDLGAYLVLDGVGGNKGGKVASFLIKSYYKNNPLEHTSSKKNEKALAVTWDILIGLAEESVLYDAAQPIFSSAFQQVYENEYGEQANSIPNFFTREEYNWIMETKDSLRGSAVMMSVNHNQHDKRLDINMAGDIQAYLIEGDEMIYDSTVGGINTINHMCFMNNIETQQQVSKLFKDEKLIRKLTEAATSLVLGHVGASMEKGVLEDLKSIQYSGKKPTYLIMVSDGVSDNVASCDIKQLAQKGNNAQEIALSIEKFLCLRYINALFTYIHEDDQESNKYTMEVQKTIKGNEGFKEMYSTFTEAFNSQDHYTAIPNWMYGCLEQGEELTGLLKYLEYSPERSNRFKLFYNELAEKGVLRRKEDNENLATTVSDFIITTYRGQVQKRKVNGLIKSLQNKSEKYLRLVKSDNYTIFVKQLV